MYFIISVMILKCIWVSVFSSIVYYCDILLCFCFVDDFYCI